MVATRAETTRRDLCDLETSLSPRTVLYQEVAARQAFASEAQARGRGSPRRPDTAFAV